MGDDHEVNPVPVDEGRYAPEAAFERGVSRARMERRLRAMLAAGVAAFALCTWLLVTREGRLAEWLWAAGPSRVVRSHLEALNRGEAGAAYAFFSVKYREEIPFPAYQRMVTSHRDLFRSRQVEFVRPTVAPDRTVVDTRLLAANGRVYVARFTLVLSEGRWWIDQVRWSDAPDPSTFTRT